MTSRITDTTLLNAARPVPVSCRPKNCDSVVSAEKEVVIRKPKRVLHFSDGVLEEYSTDEEDQTDKKQDNSLVVVDPKSLTWKPWLWYWMVYTGSSALQACDYLGESMANFLGITSPKYQYEMDEYQRTVAEEEEEKRKEKEEMAGWSTEAASNEKDLKSSITHPPSPSHNTKNWVSGASACCGDVEMRVMAHTVQDLPHTMQSSWV
ncbi:uncharacterized protein LOC143038368 isoform X2 [Oratosquilla oratoria]|uniref:uncharacterized protein LOC143038368 isoform X2 n=1 Tax=Oratosquilla oratoria TaxID=337810 RepID=UPI003F7604A3